MLLCYILLLLCFLILLSIYIQGTAVVNVDGFVNESLPPNVTNAYRQFVNFYNPFLVNWEKALTIAVSLDIPQSPQADPESPTPSTPPPPITRLQMNEYVNRLSDKLQQPLPPVTDPLPSDIRATGLPSIIPQIPKDMTPYQNALSWMNQQMRDSQTQLADALQGIPPTIEGFDANAPTCQEITQCLSNNPEFIAQFSQQIAQEQKEQQQKSSEEQQKELLNRIAPFLQNANLTQAVTTNQELATQLGTVQQQAESGELYQKINLPDKEPDVPIVLPTGGLALSSMKQTNPQQYNQLKDNYKQWFDLKSLMEQINRSL